MAHDFQIKTQPEKGEGVVKSLCERCRHLREVISGKGSRFLLCVLSQTDRRFDKYPRQPVVHCTGFARPEPKHEG